MLHLHIPTMTCGGCLGAVTRTVQKLDPHAKVEGDLEARQVTITTDKQEAVLLTALQEAGYPAEIRPVG